MRIGIGADFHRLVEGRPLILGGVRISWSRGLEGFSDADVLVHAVIDSILGAAAAGDIGSHFPDTDPAYAAADSLYLLDKARDIVGLRGWSIVNIDTVVVAEEPRLAPYVRAMRANLAGCCGVDLSCVSVKATTSEGMGPAGRGEGIEARAVALLTEKV